MSENKFVVQADQQETKQNRNTACRQSEATLRSANLVTHSSMLTDQRLQRDRINDTDRGPDAWKTKPRKCLLINKQKINIYRRYISNINFYKINHATKKCVFKGTLDKVTTYKARLSIGDLNGDGSMDIVYTGGMFDDGRTTQIWVMYGKVPNIHQNTTYRHCEVDPNYRTTGLDRKVLLNR